MEKINHKRYSNRTYPPKLCKKLDCNLEFIPTDGRQIYCSAQHRIDSNNDKRKIIEKIERDFNKKIKNNKMALIKIKNSQNYIKSGVVDKTLLDYEGYDFSVYHKKQIHIPSEREILICYNYGLMLYNALKQYYKIVEL